MPSNNIFDDIGNAIGGVFGSIGQAIDSGAKGLTRGMQPETQTAPRHVAPRKRATAASLKPAQAKEVRPDSPKGKPDEVPNDGQWHLGPGGSLTIRLPSLYRVAKQDADQTAPAGKPKPKHHVVAQTKGKNPRSRVAAHKPGPVL